MRRRFLNVIGSVPAFLVASIAISAPAQTTKQKIAIEALKILAEHGDAKAQFELGAVYENGDLLPKDSVTAAKWLRKSADQGYSEAALTLGVMYEQGDEIPRNMSEAVRLYRIAAEHGESAGQLSLGRCLYAGEGTAKDYKEAVIWLRKAVDQGHSKAGTLLGLIYEEGSADVPSDYEEAAHWFRVGSNGGDVHAQLELGKLYFLGEHVKKDWAAAAPLLKTPAERGDGTAQEALAAMYLEGGEGLEADVNEGVRWARLAANQNNHTAQYLLGLLYIKGVGVPKDTVQAHMWLNLAASGGEHADEARQAREELEQQMTPEEITEAERLAREHGSVH